MNVLRVTEEARTSCVESIVELRKEIGVMLTNAAELITPERAAKDEQSELVMTSHCAKQLAEAFSAVAALTVSLRWAEALNKAMANPAEPAPLSTVRDAMNLFLVANAGASGRAFGEPYIATYHGQAVEQAAKGVESLDKMLMVFQKGLEVCAANGIDHDAVVAGDKEANAKLTAVMMGEVLAKNAAGVNYPGKPGDTADVVAARFSLDLSQVHEIAPGVFHIAHPAATGTVPDNSFTPRPRSPDAMDDGIRA